MAATKKSVAKKTTAKKTSADNVAQVNATRIVEGLRWREGTKKPCDQQFTIMDNQYTVKDIPKFKRVDVLDHKCYKTDDNSDRVILKGVVSVIPGLMIQDDNWNPDILIKSEIKSEVSLYNDEDDSNTGPRWEANIYGITAWELFRLFPDGTFAIGCQRHALTKWVSVGKELLESYPERLKHDIPALTLLVPMLQEFLRTHKPPVKEQTTTAQVITLAQFREMLLARLDEPMVYKPKPIRKKAALKKAKK